MSDGIRGDAITHAFEDQIWYDGGVQRADAVYNALC